MSAPLAEDGGRTVVLCGFMGVGKSAIGRRLARALGRDFLDADDLVVARLQRSIPALFGAGEEGLFRSTEAEVIAEALRRRPVVVLALGGGALENKATRELVLQESLLVHLDQPFEELAMALPRLAEGRPLLAEKSPEEVRALYEQRRRHFLLAPVQVPLPRRGLASATQRVLKALGALGVVPLP